MYDIYEAIYILKHVKFWLLLCFVLVDLHVQHMRIIREFGANGGFVDHIGWFHSWISVLLNLVQYIMTAQWNIEI